MRVKPNVSRGILAGGVALGALCGAAAVAAAADQTPVSTTTISQIETVVVTASKREEKLHDVAMSVTALRGQDLQKRQDLTVASLATQVPSLSVETVGDTNRLIIRGQNAGGVGATVAVVVDDVPFSFSSSTSSGGVLTADIDTYDLNRVEVLRGPQGTLYGAAAEGGLIKYVTNPPELDQFEGGVEAGVENVAGGQTAGDIKGYVNIPIGDKIAVRASGFDEQLPGYISNPTTGQNNVNDGFKYGGRLSVLFQPTDDLSIRAGAYYQEQRINGNGLVDVVGAAATPLTPPKNQTALVDGLSFASGLPNVQKTSLFYGFLNVAYDLHWATLTSITSYGLQKYPQLADTSGTELAPGVGYADYLGTFVYGQPIYGQLHSADQLDKYTQELRLSSDPGAQIAGHDVEWQGGIFLNREDTSHTEDYAALTQSLPRTSLSPPLGNIAVGATYDEVAVFGDVTYHFAPQLDLEVGGRGTEVWQKATVSNTTGLLFGSAASLPELKSDQTSGTYSAALRWHVDENTVAYARVASGFRPGGPELNVAFAPPDYPHAYQSDSTVNYEIGLRSNLFDNTLSADVAAFYVDWSQIQITSLFTSATTGIVYQVTGNAGTATTQGFEWNINWAPISGLNIQAVGSYVDAKLTRSAPGLGAKSGDGLPYVPDVSNAINVDYSWNLVQSYEAFVGGTWAYVGREYTDFSASPLLVSHYELPSHSTIDLRAGIAYDRYTLELFAKNIGDSRALTAYTSEGAPNGYGEAATLQPRTVGLRLGVRF